ILLSIGCTFITCSKDGEGQKLPKREWTIAWSDEFNDNLVASPDVSKWSFNIGVGPNNDGWGNQELQYYTDRLDVVSTDGKGNLRIVAKKENLNNREFISGRIMTKGKFSQKYGKIEARIKTPSGPGIWPAFWLLGNNIDTVQWPNCGEIDIMEQKGNQPNTVFGSLHGPGYSGGNSKSGTYSLMNDRFDNDFHIYAVEWYEDRIDYFVDGYLYNRINKTDVSGKWVFDQPFFIILNVAVGGNFVGFPNVNTAFPQTMQVDYVRVYK
ncbi:MAG: family 16 glycosylhydrolase, partial [Chitinophagales bacterium]